MKTRRRRIARLQLGAARLSASQGLNRMRVLGTLFCVLSLVPVSPAAAQVVDQDDGVRDAHRVLQLSTAGSLLITASLGTMIAINKPTLFGDGRCAEGGAEPILGHYGCHGLSVLHGLSAIVSTVLYTATVAVEFAAYDWPGRNDHGTAYDVASAVHLGGMATLPLLGIITAVPMVLGTDQNESGDFQRVMRTLHLAFGYITVAAYGATTAIDF